MTPEHGTLSRTRAIRVAKITAAGDELAGAVEGIHQPVLPPVGTLAEGGCLAASSVSTGTWGERRQRLLEVGIGGKIGTGDRGRILLQLALEPAATIDFVKDPPAAGDRLDPRHPGQQTPAWCYPLSYYLTAHERANPLLRQPTLLASSSALMLRDLVKSGRASNLPIRLRGQGSPRGARARADPLLG